MSTLYFTPRMLLIGLLGLYSGLPLALTASTLTAWLSDAGVERAAIGLFAAVATPYAFKFLWAPVLDGVRVPVLARLLGRRRSWMLLAQMGLVVAIAAMAMFDPAKAAQWTALCAVIIATLSATQDTVIDAYRVERLSVEEQGAGAAMATFGYRIGMLLSGAGALALADAQGWQVTYWAMAGVMGSSLIVTLLAKREEGEFRGSRDARTGGSAPSPRVDSPRFNSAPPSGATRPTPFRDVVTPPLRDDAVASFSGAHAGEKVRAFFSESVVAPFRDFMQRPYWLQVLVFVILYKLGDAFMGIMFNPFLLDIGFTKTEIAKVVKVYGLIATILGAFAGGALVARWGMYRSLMVCGFGHMLTNLLLVVQAMLGHDIHFLMLSIATENFTGGMATTAFIAYLSALCKTHYTATQYALLSSLASFGRTWLSTPSGALSQAVGWPVFFAIASLMALPGLWLLWWLERKTRAAASSPG